MSSTPSGCTSPVPVVVSATGNPDLHLLGVTENKIAENSKCQGKEKSNEQFKQHLVRPANEQAKQS